MYKFHRGTDVQVFRGDIFETKEAALQRILASLVNADGNRRHQSLSAEIERDIVLATVAESLLAEYLEGIPMPSVEDESSLAAPLLLARWGWAVRDDDVKLLDNVLSSLGAAAGANFFLAQSPTAASVVGIGAALLKLFVNLRKKGIALDAFDSQFLTQLKMAPDGLTARELAVALSENAKSELEEWDVQSVESRLLQLTKKRCGDGSIVALVAKGSDEKWSAAGV